MTRENEDGMFHASTDDIAGLPRPVEDKDTAGFFLVLLFFLAVPAALGWFGRGYFETRQADQKHERAVKAWKLCEVNAGRSAEIIRQIPTVFECRDLEAACKGSQSGSAVAGALVQMKAEAIEALGRVGE